MRFMCSRSVAAFGVTLSLMFGANLSLAQGSKQVPPIAVMVGSEDAEGVTQKDFDMRALKMLESRTVEQLKGKMQSYLRSQGQATTIPRLTSESNYVELDKRKLAVVRINSPRVLNQVFVFGIIGQELRRVACVRTTDFDESIPLFYGACGERIKEVFGVAPGS